jgi:thioredoxin-like negative regulator of GroEL
MAGHSAFDDHLAQAADWHAEGQYDRAAEHAAAGLARTPDAPDLLRLLVRAQIARGALDAARNAADRLAPLARQGNSIDLLVTIALEMGQVQVARTILSGAEASAEIPVAEIARLKARIAMDQGDFDAAKAILVAAIDRQPEAPALRTLMAEVMVAAGTAGDVRAVLTHIAQPPVNPVDPNAEPDIEDTPAAPGSRSG